MPRGGGGVYLRPASDVNPPVALQVIDPIAFDQALADIAMELTNSLDRLGRGPMQAILAMAGFRISNLGAPIAQNDAARLADFGSYLPPGAIMDFAMNTPPLGWLECDGSTFSRTGQSGLFAAIGTTYGVGDGSTTANLPDFRGTVRRAWDHGKGLDPARVFGSYQADAFASHTHVQNPHTHTDSGHTHPSLKPLGPVGAAGSAVNAGTGADTTGTGTANISNTTAVNQATGGAETKMKNYAVLVCIRT